MLDRHGTSEHLLDFPVFPLSVAENNGYADGGFGVNLPYHTFAEVKITYQNWEGGFISIPVSFGVNF